MSAPSFLEYPFMNVQELSVHALALEYYVIHSFITLWLLSEKKYGEHIRSISVFQCAGKSILPALQTLCSEKERLSMSIFLSDLSQGYST